MLALLKIIQNFFTQLLNIVLSKQTSESRNDRVCSDPLPIHRREPFLTEGLTKYPEPTTKPIAPPGQSKPKRKKAAPKAKPASAGKPKPTRKVVPKPPKT